MTAARAERPSARILLLDGEGRVLLFRFDPPDRAPFWATPGGALDPGEAFAVGARRELLEETGLDLDCGPEVARRLAEFVTLEGVPVAADERYFLVRTEAGEIATEGHTELERRGDAWLALVHPRAKLPPMTNRSFPGTCSTC
jgi:8-oxo-dGTP diphosphatase